MPENMFKINEIIPKVLQNLDEIKLKREREKVKESETQTIKDLTGLLGSCNTNPAAEKKAAWFDNQNNTAGDRATRYFFARNQCPDSMSGSGGRPKGLPVLCSGLSTCPYSLTLLTRGDETDPLNTGVRHD